MTIYKELLERVANGESFSIDFEKRTMKIGKQKIIDNGEYDTARELTDFGNADIDYIMEYIKHFYKQYKYSLPSERSENKRRTYFKALPMDKISDEYLFTAERREIAQARLEGFILCMILTGNLVWDENKFGKWFYQSKNDSDFVILRSWIENKNNQLIKEK